MVYLAAPVEVLRARRTGRADRIEAEGDEFLGAVARAYDALAAERGWAVLDATADPDVVEAAVWDVVEHRVPA